MKLLKFSTQLDAGWNGMRKKPDWMFTVIVDIVEV